VITPEPSNEFPWISIWRLVKPHPNYFVYILKARWLRPAFAELYRLWRMTLSKELVAVHVWNAPDQFHNWRVAGVRANTTPVKLNVKAGPLPSLHWVFTILLVSVGCCFFCVFSRAFRWFRVFVQPFKYRIYYYFSTIFWVLASGLPSAKFPLAQTSATLLHLIKARLYCT